MKRNVPDKAKGAVARIHDWKCATCGINVWELWEGLFPERPAIVGDWRTVKRVHPRQHERELRLALMQVLYLHEYRLALLEGRPRYLEMAPWAHGLGPGDALWHTDHIKPLSEGGDNSLANLRLLCLNCHKQETKTLQKRLARRPVNKRTVERM